MRTISALKLSDGSIPFEIWVSQLSIETRAIIDSNIDRVAMGGGKKNVKALKDGIFEIKINFGPGYRVYFAEEGKSLILLILGGDKSSQKKDIKRAKKMWRDYAQK